MALLQSFLDFARYEKPEGRHFSLNDLLQEVMFLIKAQKQKKQIDYYVHLESKQEVLGDFDKLKQACLNIILNAIDSTEKVSQPQLIVRTWDEKGSIFLEISDNGCGISEKGLESLFQPFYTTKTKGTGLGLAVTHKILESHGVEVSVKSKQNKGTTFILTFGVVSSKKEMKEGA